MRNYIKDAEVDFKLKIHSRLTVEFTLVQRQDRVFLYQKDLVDAEGKNKVLLINASVNQGFLIVYSYEARLIYFKDVIKAKIIKLLKLRKLPSTKKKIVKL